MKPWQESVVESLRDLSSLEQQKRSWLDEDGVEFPCSPGELVCQLFDDTGLGDRLEAGEAFSSECDLILSELNRRVDGVRLDQPMNSLLEDPAWLEIASMAKMALGEIERVSRERENSGD